MSGLIYWHKKLLSYTLSTETWPHPGGTTLCHPRRRSIWTEEHGLGVMLSFPAHRSYEKVGEKKYGKAGGAALLRTPRLLLHIRCVRYKPCLSRPSAQVPFPSSSWGQPGWRRPLKQVHGARTLQPELDPVSSGCETHSVSSPAIYKMLGRDDDGHR